MAEYRLPSPAALSSSPELIQEVLVHLFEPSPTLYSLVASQLPRGFDGYDAFADFVAGLLLGLKDSGETETLLRVLGAHPRLGAAKVESLHSQGEQRSLMAATAAGVEEMERLKQLNDKYEETFPGGFFLFFFSFFSFGGEGIFAGFTGRADTPGDRDEVCGVC
jgi:2-oxo-4-hydroxy-4-carboxy--5-ureidoimidazoline (OHCU) decarboxylase